MILDKKSRISDLYLIPPPGYLSLFNRYFDIIDKLLLYKYHYLLLLEYTYEQFILLINNSHL